MLMMTVMMMITTMELLFISLLIVGLSPVSTDYAAAEAAEPLRTYIVHAPEKGMPRVFASCKTWHSELLASVLPGGASPEDRVLYWYETVTRGFAAALSPQEAAALRARKGVVMATADRLMHLHTTRSPSFLGLAAFPEQARSMGALWPASHRGADVIVGVIDTGIWPESSSFRDDGFSPVPPRWRGTCESSLSDASPVVCNRKLVGARVFFKGYEAEVGRINETEEFRSPRDANGHGTHTASTAVGCPVQNASLFGLANGTAAGVAPAARLAVYKACWSDGSCSTADVLSAFEAAISDGVDVISVSLGGGGPGESSDYATDSIAIGALAASTRGILTVASAGNSGPLPKSVGNVAPWILTVAASSLDRSFPAPVVLGDGNRYRGFSLYTGAGLDRRQLPLIYAAHAALDRTAAMRTNFSMAATNASRCLPGFLDPELVRGKIVLCDRGLSAPAAKGFVVQEAGGAGMLVGYIFEGSIGVSFPLPAAVIGILETESIKQYIASTPNATATLLFPGTRWNVRPAPVVAAFSSRGPNIATPEILKPDITAPGLNILAAWTGFAGPSGVAADERRVEFNIISGTSMSCPHAAGVAALLKAAHPGWSPAAISSAMMTTAVVRDRTGGPLLDEFQMGPADPTAYGAGQVHPNAALEPGLVYDVQPGDYVDFLCGVPDNDTGNSTVLRVLCSSRNNTLRPGDLNYPSFSLVYRYNITHRTPTPFSSTLSRSLTNVSPSPLPATYNVSVVPPPNVNVSITPTSLSFSALSQTLSYSITFTALPALSASAVVDEEEDEHYEFGSLTWSDGYHTVRSPIMFTWVIKTQ